MLVVSNPKWPNDDAAGAGRPAPRLAGKDTFHISLFDAPPQPDRNVWQLVPTMCLWPLQIQDQSKGEFGLLVQSTIRAPHLLS